MQQTHFSFSLPMLKIKLQYLGCWNHTDLFWNWSEDLFNCFRLWLMWKVLGFREIARRWTHSLGFLQFSCFLLCFFTISYSRIKLYYLSIPKFLLFICLFACFYNWICLFLALAIFKVKYLITSLEVTVFLVWIWLLICYIFIFCYICGSKMSIKTPQSQ